MNTSIPVLRLAAIMVFAAMFLCPSVAIAAVDGPLVLGIPVEFILFALTLFSVALFHHHTLRVALIGLASIVIYKLLFAEFKTGAGLSGFGLHLAHEWVILTNLLGLLLGFAILSKHFEESHIPAWLPKFLPDDWKGGFVLLVMIFVLSGFLDNIAAAMIGGTIAMTVFRGKVHIGYLAAIVAAANAGGAGSVLGDTTTTMMWIDGVSPFAVIDAYVGASVALLIFGIPAAIRQHKYSPITKDASAGIVIDGMRVAIVVFILAAAIVTNVIINSRYTHLSDSFPFIGAAIWVAIIVAAPVRKPDWGLLPEALKGSIFLLCLILCASLMPVEKLPAASWQATFVLGFVSSVFDNIPLTALALKQEGYDWGMLAYAVGFGGSMIWFGSSAGVAVSNLFPEAKSVGRWLRHGWYIGVAYIVGFAVMLALLGWYPTAKNKPGTAAPVASMPR